MCQGGISGRPKYPNKRHYRLVRRGVGTRRANYLFWGVVPHSLTHTNTYTHIQEKDDDEPTQRERCFRPTLTQTWGLLGLDSHAGRPPRVFTWHANNARQNNKEEEEVEEEERAGVRSVKGFEGDSPENYDVLSDYYPLPLLLSFFFVSWTCRQIRWTKM